MNPLAIWSLIKKFLPTKKIAAWILGAIGVVLAGFMGVNNADLKKAFCEADLVELPAAVSPATKVDPTPTK